MQNENADAGASANALVAAAPSGSDDVDDAAIIFYLPDQGYDEYPYGQVTNGRIAHERKLEGTSQARRHKTSRVWCMGESESHSFPFPVTARGLSPGPHSPPNTKTPPPGGNLQADCPRDPQWLTEVVSVVI